jgi:hypothetical protein
MSDDVLRNLGNRIIKTSGQLVDDAGNAIKTGDDFIAAVKKSSLKAKGGLSKLALQTTAKSLMKMNPPVSGTLRKSLTDKAAQLALKDANYAAKNGDDVAKALKKKGYQTDIADEIGKKFDMKKGGKTKPKPKPDPSKIDDVTKLSQENLVGIKSVLGKHWNYIEKMYRNGASRSYVRKWVIGMGLSVVAFNMFWNWLTGDDKKQSCNPGEYFDGAKCVKIPIPIPNQCPSGTFWNGVKCVSGKTPVPKKVCNDFPYTIGCSSSVISEVQKCLNISSDGIFGKQTLNALTSGGYGSEITKEVYDKIKSKCSSSSSTVVDPNVANPDSEQYTETGYNDL